MGVATMTAIISGYFWHKHVRNQSLQFRESEFIPLSLAHSTRVTPTIHALTFQLPTALPASHFSRIPFAVYAKHDLIQIERPYTPTSLLRNDQGDVVGFEVMLRVYPDGTMSRFLAKKEKGDLVEWRGPVHHAHFTLDANRHRSLLLVSSLSCILFFLE